MKKRLKWFSAFIFAVFCMFFVSMNTEAARTLGLSLHYNKENVSFHLYRVADYEERNGFTLVEPFSNYQVNLEGLNIKEIDSEAWRTLAETLSGYVISDNVAYTLTGTTDKDGNIVWDGMTRGLYLVMGDVSKDENYIYTSTPVMVMIPGVSENNVYVTHPELSIKCMTELRQKVNRKVVKIWKDDGNTSKRPKEITIALLNEEGVYDTVKLTKENNWRYTWKNLPADFSWKVSEKEVPKNYRVSVDRDEDTFVVTNTYKEPEDTPKDPDTPKNPTKNPETPEDTPETPSVRPQTSETTSENVLPQTGQLWWPIPLLAFLGITVFAAGWVKSKEKSSCLFMTVGVLFLAAAVMLVGKNNYDDQRAGELSEKAAKVFVQEVERIKEEQDYDIIAGMEMPAIEIDGERYVGVLCIPSLGLELPIMEECTERGLKTSPCLYEGNVYENNMVIAGHNYRKHFSGLKTLQEGTLLTFTDADGNVFSYNVAWSEILQPSDIEKMTDAKEWDITLFTCTYGGNERYAVRCIRAES